MEEQRKSDLLEVLKREPNYGACKASILDCLLQEKPDGAAVRLANFAAFLISKGVPPNGLGLFLSKRAAFMESAEVFSFSCETAPVYGDEKAAIKLTEFAEFKCPFCGTVSPLLKKLVDESNGAVRLCFKHFPLLGHEGTILASTAAVAAQRQGKFWEMAALLFQNMDKNQEDQVLDLASNLGLDMDRFKTDLADPEIAKMLRADKVEGARNKVNATPTLFINGKHYSLRIDEALLKDIINEEAERVGLAPPYKDWIYQ
jgi:predicted DsbA family dithiol-disulfide isomerase